jgi:hypothetical protein
MKYIDDNDNSNDVIHNICELNKEFEDNWKKIEQNKNDVLKVKHVRYKSNDFKYKNGDCDNRDKSLQRLKNVIERTKCNFYKRQLTDINNESMFESFIKEKKLQMKKQLQSEGNIYSNSNTNSQHVRKKCFHDKKSFLNYDKHSDISHHHSTIKPLYIKTIKHQKQNNKCIVTHKDSPIYNKIRHIYNELSTNGNINSSQKQDYNKHKNNSNNINKDNNNTLYQHININNISLKDLHTHFNDIFTSITPNMKISNQFPTFTRSKSPYIYHNPFSNKPHPKPTPTSSHTLDKPNTKHKKSLIYTKKICLKSNSNNLYKSTPTLFNIKPSSTHHLSQIN